jgi:MoxR-like ATPase
VAGVTVGRLAGLLRRHGADRLLLLGPPGIGKSTAVREYAEERAREMGLRFVDLAEAESSRVSVEGSYLYLHIYAPLVRPEDLAFIARVDGGYDWVLPSKLRLLASPGARGLVFIDEITNAVVPEVQTMLLSLVLDKRVAYTRLSPGVEVVAAGNRPGESSIAAPLPAPLLDRFRLLVDVKPPTVDEWVSWMNRAGRPWDRRVAAALRAKPWLMLRLPRGDSMEKFPTPRSWSSLAWELAAAGRPEGREALEIAEMAVGPEAARELEPFLAPAGRGAPGLEAAGVAEAIASRGLEAACGELETLASKSPADAAWALVLAGVDPVRAASSGCRAASEVVRLAYRYTS